MLDYNPNQIYCFPFLIHKTLVLQNVYDICLPFCLKSNDLVSILGAIHFQPLGFHHQMFLLLDIFHRKVYHPAPFLDTTGFPQLS